MVFGPSVPIISAADPKDSSSRRVMASTKPHETGKVWSDRRRYVLCYIYIYSCIYSIWYMCIYMNLIHMNVYECMWYASWEYISLSLSVRMPSFQHKSHHIWWNVLFTPSIFHQTRSTCKLPLTLINDLEPYLDVGDMTGTIVAPSKP